MVFLTLDMIYTDIRVIKIVKSTEYEVVDNFIEETEEIISHNHIFREGTEYEVDLLEDHGECCDFQFCDGSVLYKFPKEFFIVLE